MTPILSILICGVPRRISMAQALIAELEGQIERSQNGAKELGVEILYLLDNKKRTIGAKRQALLDIARGTYVSWIDDDDLPMPAYLDQILFCLNMFKARIPDVVVYPVKVTINGKDEGIVDMSIRHVPKDGEAMAEYKPGQVTPRPPHEIAVWRSAIARQARFDDVNAGEDFAWARQLWPLVKHEVQAAPFSEPLYWYRFNMALAEPGVGK